MVRTEENGQNKYTYSLGLVYKMMKAECFGVESFVPDSIWKLVQMAQHFCRVRRRCMRDRKCRLKYKVSNEKQNTK